MPRGPGPCSCWPRPSAETPDSLRSSRTSARGLQDRAELAAVPERAGLIARGREAQWRPCRLKAAPLKEVAEWAESGTRVTNGWMST